MLLSAALMPNAVVHPQLCIQLFCLIRPICRLCSLHISPLRAGSFSTSARMTKNTCLVVQAFHQVDIVIIFSLTTALTAIRRGIWHNYPFDCQKVSTLWCRSNISISHLNLDEIAVLAEGRVQLLTIHSWRTQMTLLAAPPEPLNPHNHRSVFILSCTVAYCCGHCADGKTPNYPHSKQTGTLRVY